MDNSKRLVLNGVCGTIIENSIGAIYNAKYLTSNQAHLRSVCRATDSPSVLECGNDNLNKFGF